MSDKTFNPQPVRFSISVMVSDEYAEDVGREVALVLDDETKRQCHPDYEKNAKHVVDSKDRSLDCSTRLVYLDLYQVEGGFSFTKPDDGAES